MVKISHTTKSDISLPSAAGAPPPTLFLAVLFFHLFSYAVLPWQHHSPLSSYLASTPRPTCFPPATSAPTRAPLRPSPGPRLKPPLTQELLRATSVPTATTSYLQNQQAETRFLISGTKKSAVKPHYGLIVGTKKPVTRPALSDTSNGYITTIGTASWLSTGYLHSGALNRCRHYSTKKAGQKTSDVLHTSAEPIKSLITTSSFLKRN